MNMLLTDHFSTSCQHFGGVEAVAAEQDSFGAACDLRQLMNAGTMRQRRNDERGVVLRRAGHQVAEMIGDDETHLAVRQHGGLRPPRRSRREEEPARIVAFDGCLRRALSVVPRYQRVVIVAERRILK